MNKNITDTHSCQVPFYTIFRKMIQNKLVPCPLAKLDKVKIVNKLDKYIWGKLALATLYSFPNVLTKISNNFSTLAILRNVCLDEVHTIFSSLTISSFFSEILGNVCFDENFRQYFCP